MSWAFFSEAIFWILPPALGAIIGYVTNYLAIKMLFRPLTEKRILGIRIPLTPGIIPKQRKQLAESIGNMVSKNLLTSDTIKSHISSNRFKCEIQNNISSFSADILNKPLSYLNDKNLSLIYDFLEKFLNKALYTLLHAENFKHSLKKLIENIIDSISQKKIKDLTAKVEIKNVFVSYIIPFITGDKIKDWLYNEISAWMKDKLKNNTPLNEIIPKSIVDDIMVGFGRFFPDFLKILFNWLSLSVTKTSFEKQGRALLKNIFKKLNIFQQFVISVGQFDKTLDEKMPEIIDDVLSSLKKAAFNHVNQRNFMESSRKGILKWFKNGVFDLFYSRAIDIDEVPRVIVDKLFFILKSEKAKSFLINKIDDFIQQNKEKSIKEVFKNQFDIRVENISTFLHEVTSHFLEKEETARNISNVLGKMIIQLLSGLKDKCLIEILGLDEELKEKLDLFLSEKLIAIIEGKLPDLIASLNVKLIVVNKINQLDVEDVERLLLMVIDKHLKWINIFGAVLGALIGCIQVILNLLK